MPPSCCSNGGLPPKLCCKPTGVVRQLRLAADRFRRCGISHFRPVRVDSGMIGSSFRC
jgi:hypothetical protein